MLTLVKHLAEMFLVRYSSMTDSGAFIRHLFLYCAMLGVFSTQGSSSAATLKYLPVATLPTGSSIPLSFATGDFNGDGAIDLAVPAFEGSTVDVYLNQGNGSFDPPISTTVATSSIFAVASGDFNGDGKADLVLSVQGSTLGSVAIVLLGKGDGSFDVLAPIPDSFSFLSGQVADFNADGFLDVFAGGNGQTYLYLGRGDGTFSSPVNPVGSGGDYVGVTVGDFNADGHLDAIGGDNYRSSIDFFPGNGDGTFGTSLLNIEPILSYPTSIDSADFNGDGKLDLLFGGSGGIAVVVPGNGDGSFEADSSKWPFLYGQPDTQACCDSIVSVASDLDQDGNSDAAILDGTLGVLTLVLNDGTGTFKDAYSTPYTYQLPANSFRMAATDLNGDGLPDIIVSNRDVKTMSILLSVKPLIIPSVAVSANTASALVGTSLTFTVKVTGGNKAATGMVTLLDGSTSIAQQLLDSSASAVFNVNGLLGGVHSLTFSYSGDLNYAQGNSAAFDEAVTDFQLAVTPATLTITGGAAASYTMTINTVAGFAGTLSVSCSGLPTLTSCRPDSTSVSGTQAATTVIVTTTATTSATSNRSSNLIYALMFPWILLLMRRNNALARRRFYEVSIGIAVVSLLTGAVSGCGSGSTKRTPGTPAGTSTITISATAVQNGVVVTHSATTTLVVQ